MKPFHFWVLALMILLASSCASLSEQKIPTLSFYEYAFEEESDNQTKEDISIELDVISLSQVYDYPEYFGFRINHLSEPYKSDPQIKSSYKTGPLALSWENPFVSPDGKQQILLCECSLKNNTEHILRMNDARIYLVIEGLDPIEAISSNSKLLSLADYFEDLMNRERTSQTFLYILSMPPLPEGFYREIVETNRDAYELINGFDNEILPGHTFNGVLAFPVIPAFEENAKIDFFDITVKTDAAGNPLKKTTFSFPLKRRYIQMWYNRESNMWVLGNPSSFN